VTLVGCITLVGASVVLANASWRDRLVEEVPAALAALVPSLGVAEAQAAETDGSAANDPVTAVVTDPQQRHVTQYLARRYRVADEAVRMLVAAAYEAGQEKQLDPLLILAVMAVESSMNPFAQSSMGAQGLMQVMTRVHTDKFQPHGGDQAALDPIANIKVGSAILQDLVRRGGSVERGLQLYVGAGNLEDDGGYAARVLGERARIAMAATGKVDSALAAGMRSDITRPEIKPVVEVVKPQTDAAEAPAAGSETVKPADRAA
jgi:soluble lytic murein transglycosylase-like protein